MADNSIRETNGQSVVVQVEGSQDRFRFLSALTPNSKPEFSNSRAFGSMNDTGSEYLKESSETGLDSGGTVYLAEMVLAGAATFGAPVKTVLPSGLNRYAFVNKSYELTEPVKLDITRGNARIAEAVTGCVGSAMGISVNQGGGNNSLTATFLGSALDVDTADIGTSGVQTIAVTGTPTSGTFKLTTTAGDTTTLTKTATATQVENALNAVLGAGQVVVSGTNVSDGAVTVKFVGITGPVAKLTSTNTFDTGSVAITVVRAGGDVPSVPDVSVAPGLLAVYLGTSRPSADDPDVNAAVNGQIPTSFDWASADRRQPFYAQKGTGASPTAFLTGAASASTSSWLVGNGAGIDVIRQARNSTRLYHSGVAYRADGQGYQIHASGRVTAMDDFGDSQGAYGYAPTITSQHDDAWGGSQLIVIDTTFDITF